ncbi:MAG: VOC family protein [Gemmatimonadaceae bacterium]|nr:VOC family protein [Gemmatimonadaceae bacterium]
MPADVGIRPPGYRLPESAHIRRVRLQVSDLNRSIAYYENVLGLQVLKRSSEGASLGPRGEDKVILELVELRGARAVPRRDQ